jgi:polynucleotide 5'-kinase involved in rRNA processing
MRWRELYPEWQQVVDELVASRETVLVLGGIDSGKTTFCSLLLKLKHQAGMQVGFVDLDAGQTTVGPPAAFSSVVIRKPYELLQDLTPDSLAFLGDVSPVRHIPLALSGARRVLDDLLPLQPDSVVIDTDGYIGGWHGRAYKLMLIDLLRPQVIVALQRKDELAPIVGALRRRADWKLHELPVPQAILRKSPPFRGPVSARRVRPLLRTGAIAHAAAGSVQFHRQAAGRGAADVRSAPPLPRRPSARRPAACRDGRRLAAPDCAPAA